jgi:hypothetical protein
MQEPPVAETESPGVRHRTKLSYYTSHLTLSSLLLPSHYVLLVSYSPRCDSPPELLVDAEKI